MKTIKAWHFLPEDRKLQYGDGRKIRKGRKLTVEGPVTLCTRGLHASIRAIDALQYAPGPIICSVEIGGESAPDDDKIVGTERTVIWWADATNTLHEFACLCATNALKTAKVEDERCWNAIAVKLRWLKGEATDEELAAARDAARVAARDAARAAAWDAARAAAWDAARDASQDAARAAAWDAARDASQDATRAAAWDASQDATRAAAWDVAWDAARDAARDAQNTKLTAMLNKLAN